MNMLKGTFALLLCVSAAAYAGNGADKEKAPPADKKAKEKAVQPQTVAAPAPLVFDKKK